MIAEITGPEAVVVLGLMTMFGFLVWCGCKFGGRK